MTNETDARSTLMDLHRQVCFENGDHPDEVDTPYSVGADAITRADLSDAKIVEAEQRGYAKAMDAERKDAEARIAELEAECAAAWGKCGERRLAQEAAESRIAELEARNRELALDVMSSNSQAHDAYDRQKELKTKLAKAVDGLRECEDEIDQCVWNEYPHDHPVQERYRQRGFAANPARATLAELKGTD